MRKTKIICTIGPSSQNEDKLRQLMKAGMNVARFNFSHGDHEEQKMKFINVKKVREELNLPIATMLDTKGPEIRLKEFADGKVELKAGQKFALTTEEILGTSERASITYKNLKNDVKVGNMILIDDGLIGMTIEEITDTDIICKVVNGGYVSNKKGINAPGAVLSMEYISEADKADILFGIEMGFDFIACSFVRSREDVLDVRRILDAHGSDIKIISKIENVQGIRNLKEILEVSDGLMVARGDMGVEVPLEDVPVIQKMMIKEANAAGKFVITATQMLDSMIHNPRPTRAESTDVANAIYDGTTAIMLSGETANGDYPLEAVQTMDRIARRTEQDIDYAGRLKKHPVEEGCSVTTAISHATCTTAVDLNARAIVTVTMSGGTAQMISRYKPGCQIIGCTMDDRVARQMNVLWGVMPLKINKKQSTDELFREAVKVAIDSEYVKPGDRVVITAGIPLGKSGTTNMIQVVEA